MSNDKEQTMNCKQCGSTAIDHTEAACRDNRIVIKETFTVPSVNIVIYEDGKVVQVLPGKGNKE